MREFNWSPGIGDPTFMGWLTVVLYFVTAWASLRTSALLASCARARDREILVWRAITLLFIALGINKQLDLQTAFTEIGRYLARRHGWYDQRESVQVAFIGLVAVTSAGAVGVLLVLCRKVLRETALAIVGTAGVLAYVLIRASSFHHIDRFIGQTILGARWNWVLEIGGIVAVLVATLQRRNRLRAGPLLPARERG